MIPAPTRTAGAVCAVLGVLLASSLLAFEFLARPWVVVGVSMEPTLRAGDRIIVDLWTYGHRLPRPIGRLPGENALHPTLIAA